MKSPFIALAVPACLMFVLNAPVPALGQGLSSWETVATGEKTSPMAGQAASGDVIKSWSGTDGMTIEAVVLAPRPTGSYTATLSPSSGVDNGPLIIAALNDVESHGGGQLTLTAGEYDINNLTSGGAPQLKLSGYHDITISGTGATLMMMQWGTGISISYSQRIHLIGLTVRYANPPIVTGSIVSTGSGKALNISGGLLQSPGSQQAIFQITTLNSQGSGYSIAPTSYRYLAGTTPATFSSIGSDDYTNNTALTHFNVGDLVAVKLSYYAGAAIQVNDAGNSAGTASSDLTLDRLTIANSPGMGILVSRMGRGLAIENCSLGPVAQSDGTTSIAYDGIHVSSSGGDLLILSNQINGTGDDAINLAGMIMPVNGAGSTPGTVQVGGASYVIPNEMISLFDSQLNYLGTGTVSSRSSTIAATGDSTITFVTPVANSQLAVYAREGAVLGSRYAVSANVVANCDCHGLLAQLPNGLISNNQFTGLRYNAIRLITSGRYGEGTGALNVVVLNNQISNTGADLRTGFVSAAITTYGELSMSSALTKMTPSAVNRDIKIYTNTISQTQDACISIGDAQNATLQGNTCNQTMLGGPPVTGPGGGTFASYSGGDQLRSEGIFIDPDTTSNVNVTGQQ